MQYCHGVGIHYWMVGEVFHEELVIFSAELNIRQVVSDRNSMVVGVFPPRVDPGLVVPLENSLISMSEMGPGMPSSRF